MGYGEPKPANGAGRAPRLTAGRSTGRPEGSARQATKQVPRRRRRAIEQRIGESPCEAGPCGVRLAFPSQFRIIVWTHRRIGSNVVARVIIARTMALASGSKVGPYEIQSPLGAGGMGEVYRAKDTRLGRDVALKILPESFAREIDRLRRFEQEARAVAALNHPNILAIHDIGQHEGSPYLVSELLEGESLGATLDRGALPQRKTIEYGVQITQGLAAAHEKGIVHRDLKPENIFVTKDGRIKILDFGLAKLAQKAGAGSDEVTLTSERTAAGVVMGTASYMAPEQVRGEAADPRTDIFAFGAVLYEMLSGVRAFRRDTPAETMTAVLKDDPPELSDLGRL